MGIKNEQRMANALSLIEKAAASALTLDNADTKNLALRFIRDVCQSLVVAQREPS